jgi:hypothetical protein
MACLLSANFGCSDPDTAGNPADTSQGGASAELGPSEPMGECEVRLQQFTNGSSSHVGECSDVEYSMSPPVLGDHYPVWAAYQTYDYPVPLGYLVHNLEHGAVVLFYDCPDGCDDEIAQAQSFIDELPLDPRCSDEIAHQVILVPRPGLGSRWAAAAWGHALTASCFDPEYFEQFYADHHGRGLEDLCNQGLVIPADACQ